MKTEPKGHVWLVQVSGTDADIWDTEENAYRAAADSALDMFFEGNEDFDDDHSIFKNSTGEDVCYANNKRILKWWNENREPFILVECKRILTK